MAITAGESHTKLEAEASEKDRPLGMIRIWSCSLLTLTCKEGRKWITDLFLNLYYSGGKFI